MKIIQNKWINKFIPFPNFRAINLFGVLFVRGARPLSDVTLNHEAIHTAQMKEMLYVFFYMWYFIEWVIRLFMGGDAYRNISFEKEAYDNQKDMYYLTKRERFNFLNYY
ncbi:MAG: hypothetical protein GX800_09745 [Clostridiaceae bacterium]|jgi:hypothetical protein|nr:hypothetical protein [Clostridiaceae bacterium]